MLKFLGGNPDGYATYQRVFDFAAYALLFTVKMVDDVMAGNLFFGFSNLVPRVTVLKTISYSVMFWIIFLSAFLLLWLMFGIYKLCENIFARVSMSEKLRHATIVFIFGIAFSFISIAYNNFFFYTGGSWIMSGSRGFGDGLGGLPVSIIGYAVVFLIGWLLLSAKKKLHRYFNTSLVLFVAAFAWSFFDLMWIFFKL